MLMFNVAMLLWSWCSAVMRPPRDHEAVLTGDDGQTTAEYALMLIAAAALAVVVIGWISKTDAIGRLFEMVMKNITGNAS